MVIMAGCAAAHSAMVGGLVGFCCLLLRAGHCPACYRAFPTPLSSFVCVSCDQQWVDVPLPVGTLSRGCCIFVCVCLWVQGDDFGIQYKKMALPEKSSVPSGPAFQVRKSGCAVVSLYWCGQGVQATVNSSNLARVAAVCTLQDERQFEQEAAQSEVQSYLVHSTRTAGKVASLEAAMEAYGGRGAGARLARIDRGL